MKADGDEDGKRRAATLATGSPVETDLPAAMGTRRRTLALDTPRTLLRVPSASSAHKPLTLLTREGAADATGEAGVAGSDRAVAGAATQEPGTLCEGEDAGEEEDEEEGADSVEAQDACGCGAILATSGSGRPTAPRATVRPQVRALPIAKLHSPAPLFSMCMDKIGREPEPCLLHSKALLLAMGEDMLVEVLVSIVRRGNLTLPLVRHLQAVADQGGHASIQAFLAQLDIAAAIPILK